MRYKTDNYILLGVEQSEIEESLSSNIERSLVGRAMLVRCLKEMGVYKDSPIYGYGEHGKPFLLNYLGWHFSISHCEKVVVCVLSSEEIGVDVEMIDEQNLELAKHVLNDKEISEVFSSSEPKRTFCYYWTKKESLLKYLGTGMSVDLRDILNQYIFDFKHFNESEYQISICCSSFK